MPGHNAVSTARCSGGGSSRLLATSSNHCKLGAVSRQIPNASARVATKGWPIPSYSGPAGLLILLIAVMLASAGCAAQGEYFGEVNPPQGNVFRFNNSTEPEYIDPALLTGQPGARLANMLFEGLTVNSAKTSKPVPAAAESWEVSPDRTVYTFHIRKNAVWSDGHPVTAQDFVYSWRRVLDPKTAARYAMLFYYIVNAQAFNEGRLKDASQLGVHALDDHTLQVKLREPVPFFLALTAHTTFFPVPRWVVEKYGDHWTDPSHIVGNGAFLLVYHRTNDRFEFVRNPRYWNAASVRLQKVIAYSVDDHHTAANMYQSGMVDWLPDSLPSEYVSYMRGRFHDLHSEPFLAIYYYAFNITHPPLNNPLVRRALNMAVDRRAITDDLLKGGQIPTSHFVPVGFSDYRSPPGPEYDPKEAARLLAEAGYPDGRGFPQMEIIFNSSELHQRIAETIQQMWASNLHIQVRLHNQEWATFLKRLRSLDYDIARDDWVADYADPTTFLDLLESGNPNNGTGWKSAEYDRLLAEARHETDASKRMAVLERAETVALQALPVMPLYTYASEALIKPYVRGIYFSPIDEHPLTHVWIDHKWKQDRAKQEGPRD